MNMIGKCTQKSPEKLGGSPSEAYGSCTVSSTSPRLTNTVVLVSRFVGGAVGNDETIASVSASSFGGAVSVKLASQDAPARSDHSQ